MLAILERPRHYRGHKQGAKMTEQKIDQAIADLNAAIMANSIILANLAALHLSRQPDHEVDKFFSCMLKTAESSKFKVRGAHGLEGQQLADTIKINALRRTNHIIADIRRFRKLMIEYDRFNG